MLEHGPILVPPDPGVGIVADQQRLDEILVRKASKRGRLRSRSYSQAGNSSASANRQVSKSEDRPNDRVSCLRTLQVTESPSLLEPVDPLVSQNSASNLPGIVA